MAIKYLEKEMSPFLYDTETDDLFRLAGSRKVEVLDSTSRLNVLDNAREVSRERALELAAESGEPESTDEPKKSRRSLSKSFRERLFKAMLDQSKNWMLSL